MHYIKKVRYAGDYKLILKFENQKSKLVNLKRYLNKGIFLELRDPEYFMKVSLNKEAGTIVWPNDADFCPDVLYRIGKII